MSEASEPTEWVDLVDELLEAGIDADEAVDVTVEDLAVEVPLAFGEDARTAAWEFDGSVRVHADGHAGPLYEWLRLWRRRREAGERDAER